MEDYCGGGHPKKSTINLCFECISKGAADLTIRRLEEERERIIKIFLDAPIDMSREQCALLARGPGNLPSRK